MGVSSSRILEVGASNTMRYRIAAARTKKHDRCLAGTIMCLMHALYHRYANPGVRKTPQQTRALSTTHLRPRFAARSEDSPRFLFGAFQSASTDAHVPRRGFTETTLRGSPRDPNPYRTRHEQALRQRWFALPRSTRNTQRVALVFRFLFPRHTRTHVFARGLTIFSSLVTFLLSSYSSL